MLYFELHGNEIGVSGWNRTNDVTRKRADLQSAATQPTVASLTFEKLPQ